MARTVEFGVSIRGKIALSAPTGEEPVNEIVDKLCRWGIATDGERETKPWRGFAGAAEGPAGAATAEVMDAVAAAEAEAIAAELIGPADRLGRMSAQGEGTASWDRGEVESIVRGVLRRQRGNGWPGAEAE